MSGASAADIRSTDLYRRAEEYFLQLHQPGFGAISDATDPALSPRGDQVAFTGHTLHRLEDEAHTCIAVVDLETGGTHRLTGPGGQQRMPRWSPTGDHLAFLADRTTKGRFQLEIIERASDGGFGPPAPLAEIPGTLESLAWSPAGDAVVVLAAPLGADAAGAQGSGTVGGDEELPGWMPEVDGGARSRFPRRAWIVPLDAAPREASPGDLNVWEIAWAGTGSLVAVASDRPEEAAWFESRLVRIDLASGAVRTLLEPTPELGLPCASPSGRWIAVVVGSCSDRTVVAGDLVVLDSGHESTRTIDTEGTDVTWCGWLDEDVLIYAGQRGLRTVIGEAGPGGSCIRWESENTCGRRYPGLGPLAGSTLALVREGYESPPEVALLAPDDQEPRVLTVLAHDGHRSLVRRAGRTESISWTAPDGVEVEGILAIPELGTPPYPLVVYVHGGPVWAWRNRWTMGYDFTPILTTAGIAVLHPNPRGSSGRGEEFRAAVLGDLGGAESGDVLSGVDALVAKSLADPDRLGVIGGSHGGFMASWLIGIDDRFAAAVAYSPVTDWRTFHLTSNDPEFCRRFLTGDPEDPRSQYTTRSPVRNAVTVSTPTLLLAGGRDRITPPGQATEFHGALQAVGVESVCVVYPEEGHGVRRFPARIDAAARITHWFSHHFRLADEAAP